MMTPSGERFGGIGHSGTDASVSATAADVPRHGRVDIHSGGHFAAGQRLDEGRRTHDLAALTVAALRHVVLHPGGMHGGTNPVAAISSGFNRVYLFALGSRDGRDAGAD